MCCNACTPAYLLYVYVCDMHLPDGTVMHVIHNLKIQPEKFQLSICDIGQEGACWFGKRARAADTENLV